MSWFDDRPWLKTGAQHEGYGRTIPDTTMLHLLDEAVRTNPDGPAIRYWGTTITYREFDAYARAFAQVLADGGFGAGDRLALYLQNVPAFPIAVFAAWKLGGQVVPLNPMYRGELEHIFSDSQPSAIVASAHAWNDRVSSWAQHIPQIFTVSEDDFIPGEVPAVIAPLLENTETGQTDFLSAINSALQSGNTDSVPAQPPVGPSDPAMIGYTSGTSGRSKGAEILHVGIAHNAQMARVQNDYGPEHSYFTLAPVFHITGFVTQMLAAVACASKLVMNYRFEPTSVLHMLREEKPHAMAGPATAFLALLAHPQFTGTEFDSFTAINSGGAPVPEALLDRFEERTGHYIGQGYGLTETSGQSAVVPQGMRAPVDEKTGTVSAGLPLASTFYRIIDLDGQEVGPGEVGEICVSGPIIARSYLNNPEATAANIPGGELRTGDVGYMDEDGWLFIIDRVKDMINSSGYKVWPREVEDVLYRHPAVMEAAVVGAPDDYRGETVAAFVSLKAGEQATEEELIEFCRERLAAYKAPHTVNFIDEVPKNASGKILRREVRRSAAEAAEASGSAQ